VDAIDDPKLQQVKLQVFDGSMKADAMERALRQLIPEVAEARKAKANNDEEVEILIEESEGLAKKLSEANARRESLLKQYNEQREATFEIMQSKNRTDEANKLIASKARLKSEKEKLLRDEMAKRAVQMEALRENEKLLREARALAEKRTREMEQQLEQQRQKHEVEARGYATLAQERDRATKRADEFGTEIETQVAEASKATHSLNRLKEKHKKTTRELKAYQDSGGTTKGGGSKAQELIIKDLRRKVKCSACDFKNDKDTVIIPCMHLHCFECIKGRIDRRERKCPSCSGKLGSKVGTDYMRVY